MISPAVYCCPLAKPYCHIAGIITKRFTMKVGLSLRSVRLSQTTSDYRGVTFFCGFSINPAGGDKADKVRSVPKL